MEKDVPQPQELLALGFSMVKRAPINSSLKSIVAPVRKGRDVVLKPGTATTLDGDTQGLALITGADFGQPGKGAVCHFRGQLHGTLLTVPY